MKITKVIGRDLKKKIGARLNLEKGNTRSLTGLHSTQVHFLIPTVCLVFIRYSREHDQSKTELSLLTNPEHIFSSFMTPFFPSLPKPSLHLHSPNHTAGC